ncbi:50S ribosomal protein L21 [Blattabacterium cuenoti]|nr:50S ribosomal protein L21 [Blattabacterium cuenoti]
MNSYAIVNIKGMQFKLFEKKYVYIPYLKLEIGKKKILDQVCLFSDDGLVYIGTPFIKDIRVNIEILKHVKGNKIIIFKKKRRKGYKIKNGFRPIYSKIKVISFFKKTSKNINA